MLGYVNTILSGRQVEFSWPGEFLCKDVKLFDTLRSVSRISTNGVVDNYRSYNFTFMHTNEITQSAVVVHNDVLNTLTIMENIMVAIRKAYKRWLYC